MTTSHVINSFVLIVLLMSRAAIAQTTHFSEREVTFHNKTVELSGTLVIPKLQTPLPTIVFLHGSGPHEREGFRPYAEEFAKIGFASLIFDKRGSGKSGGSWITASLEDLAADALAAIEFLKKTDEVDNKRIGFWGISQAGWVAPLVVSRSEDIAFMVIVSGGGASPRESELYSYRQGFDRANLNAEEVSQATKLVNTYFDYLDSGKGRSQLVELLDGIPPDQLNGLGQQLKRILPSDENRKNWRWVAAYEPAADIQKVNCPILLLFGDQDSDHPTTLAAKQWKKSLGLAGNDRVTLMVFPGAGHGIRMRDGHKGPDRAPFADGYHEIQIGWLWRNVIRK